MQEIDTSKLQMDFNPDYTMLTKIHNNLYLSPEQMEILENYNIDYRKCKDIHELLYLIESMMADIDEDDLINLADMLAERDYYENYNK